MVNSNVESPYNLVVPLLWIPLLLWSGTVLVTESANTYIVKGVPQECVAALAKKTSLILESAVTCALHTRASGATMFDYNNATCDIYESASETSLETLEFRQLMALDMLEEIALGKDTYSSGYFDTNYMKERVNDGDESTLYDSAPSQSPFWLLDLGEVRTVHLVRILPNYDGCSYVQVRLGMNLLTTGDFTSYTLFANHEGSIGHDPGLLSCYSFGVPGRYLSIQRTLPDLSEAWLVIREVRVYVSKKP